MSTHVPTPLVGPKNKDEQETSPTSFLPGLKSFNIENAKYKHYGHSMDSQQLHTIMHQADKTPGNEPKSRSSSVESGRMASPLEFPTQLPKLLDMDPKKEYSEPVMKEMLRLQVEQERTRQINAKFQLGRMVMRLIKEASAHGFDSELIRRLFLDDNDEYRQKLSQLGGPLPPPERHSSSQSNSEHTHGNPNQPNPLQNTPNPINPSQSVCTPSPMAGSSHSEGSESGTGKFPDDTRKESVSFRKHRGSDVSSAKHSPPVPVFAAPVYHSQSDRGDRDRPDEERPREETSPANHYPVVYHTSPQFLRQETGLPAQMPAQLPQQHVQMPQSFYYVNSSPPGIMPSQFFIPPPASSVRWTVPPAEKRKEDEPQPKRHKGKAINFMISTPKNPPASKYNKS